MLFLKIKTRNKVFEELLEEGIKTNLHYFPVHLQPYYENLGFRYGDFPEAEQFFREAISIPIYPSLSVSLQEAVVKVLSRELCNE